VRIGDSTTLMSKSKAVPLGDDGQSTPPWERWEGDGQDWFLPAELVRHTVRTIRSCCTAQHGCTLRRPYGQRHPTRAAAEKQVPHPASGRHCHGCKKNLVTPSTSP